MAAGNAGHDADPATSSLLPPADAFQEVTCGAVDETGANALFTSDGPTADGRTKPKVLAPGVAACTVSPTFDQVGQTVNGTSFATPITAGAVACVVQAHPEWTVDQMRSVRRTPHRRLPGISTRTATWTPTAPSASPICWRCWCIGAD